MNCTCLIYGILTYIIIVVHLQITLFVITAWYIIIISMIDQMINTLKLIIVIMIYQLIKRLIKWLTILQLIIVHMIYQLINLFTINYSANDRLIN